MFTAKIILELHMNGLTFWVIENHNAHFPHDIRFLNSIDHILPFFYSFHTVEAKVGKLTNLLILNAQSVTGGHKSYCVITQSVRNKLEPYLSQP